MPVKDIQVYVDNDEANENRVLNAAGLSAHFGAHLTGLYVMRTIPALAYSGAISAVSVYHVMQQEAIDQCDLAGQAYDRIISSTELNNDFRALDGEIIEELSVQSRYADLLVLPQNQKHDSGLNASYQVGSILLCAACPILVLPSAQVAFTSPPKTAMLAWDGSRECAVALRSALPMLQRVAKIDVVSVASIDAAAIDITLHLKRHGIEAETHLMKGSKHDAGRILLDKAAALNSQLLVMGAYGHSRLREMVLGGSTKYVLEHAKLPVIFAH